jgi:hypothetical protein
MRAERMLRLSPTAAAMFLRIHADPSGIEQHAERVGEDELKREGASVARLLDSTSGDDSSTTRADFVRGLNNATSLGDVYALIVRGAEEVATMRFGLVMPAKARDANFRALGAARDSADNDEQSVTRVKRALLARLDAAGLDEDAIEKKKSPAELRAAVRDMHAAGHTVALLVRVVGKSERTVRTWCATDPGNLHPPDAKVDQ